MTLKSKQSIIELPTSYADKLGLLYTNNVSIEHKKALGQYFTPIEVAKLMAQFYHLDKEKIRILDPGCGIGILSCALIEFISDNFPNVKEIEVTVFETDLDILPYTEKCFSYLGKWLHRKGILLTQFVCVNDFILHNASVLENQPNSEEMFDVVICNPPYFKIAKDDPINKAAKSIIHGQTNIYSIFLILSGKLLKEGGQLIFITPRSFTSGSYFRLFREIFFSMIDFENIHLFDSRKEAFGRDKVLQENIVISCKKNTKFLNQLSIPFKEKKSINISVSNGLDDLGNRKSKHYSIDQLVDLKSYQKNLHIPTSSKDDKVISLFKSWKFKLKDFNISISTGKVVAHRAADYLIRNEINGCVPLFWLNNVEKMKFTWPITKFAKNKEKLQYILNNKATKSILIENKDYIFLRRFSSKDDHSKLIASYYFKSRFEKYKMIGVENHLNYIYRDKGKLLKSEILGISALLNSKLFDVYFRTFNGNINVSATELREIPLPDIKIIKKIGLMIGGDTFDQVYIDKIIGKIFKIDLKDLQLWMS